MNQLIIRVLFLLSLACVACQGERASEPSRERPGMSVAKVVGDPSETDTNCTSARWASGMCDLVIAYDSGTSPGPDPYYLPHEVVQWGVGALSTEVPPTIWERGTVTDPTYGPVARSVRVWLYDFQQMWSRLCATETGTCGFHAVYDVPSSAYPHRLALYYGRIGATGPLRFQALQFTAYDAEDVDFPYVFSVAYDTGVGAYGVTTASRLTTLNGGPAAATAPAAYTTTLAGTYDSHHLPNAEGVLFSAHGLPRHWGSNFLWSADE